MKLAPMMMLLIILQLTIIFFHSSYTTDSYTLDVYNSTTIVNASENSIFNFILDPTGWSASAIFTLLLGLMGVTGAAILIGSFFSNKSDSIIFFPVAVALLGFGAIPIISLYYVFMDSAYYFGCTDIGVICINAIIVWGLTAGLIGWFYVLSVLEWWSGRPTS